MEEKTHVRLPGETGVSRRNGEPLPLKLRNTIECCDGPRGTHDRRETLVPRAAVRLIVFLVVLLLKMSKILRRSKPDTIR